jgi:DNA polymerase III alpha subunit (gram-positive type)
MRWLGIDLETTGLDLQNDRIIEIGAVLWDTTRKAPLSVFSTLIKHEGLIISREITELTGITIEDVTEFGYPLPVVAPRLYALAQKADAIVAHNGHAFDKPMLVNGLNAIGQDYRHIAEMFHVKQLIDTKVDLPYPKGKGSGSLGVIAMQHRFLNPFAHRALFDVMTMLEVASNYETSAIMELAKSPLVELIAKVSYDDRNLARTNGFYWQPESKQWTRNVKQSQIASLNLPFNFTVKDLSNANYSGPMP